MATSEVNKTPIWATVHVLGHLGKTNTAQKTTFHQVSTMLATSKNVLFPGHNHQLTTGADLTLIIARAPVRVIIKVSGSSALVDGYDMEIEHF